MTNEHHKLNLFARELTIFFNMNNGNTSDAHYMLKEMSAQDAIEYLKKYHGEIQTNMFKASQAFRNLKRIAGIPEPGDSNGS